MSLPFEKLHSLVFSHLNLDISNVHEDLECREYSGFNFLLDQWTVKFRKSKITPTKTGQFVTLWKRNFKTKDTEPFTSNDPFLFFIILTETPENSGFFFFTKEALIQNQILASPIKQGKRGFRVYPTWDHPENKQAVKTQNWQALFFIDFADKNHLSKFDSILNSQM